MRIDVVVIIILIAIFSLGVSITNGIQTHEELIVLQKKVDELTKENSNLKEKVQSLEVQNQSLTKKMEEVQVSNTCPTPEKSTLSWIIQAGLVSLLGMQAIVIRKRNPGSLGKLQKQDPSQFILLTKEERQMVIRNRRQQ
jgi:FtsZ-binding cell division protein ZapB